MIKKTFLFLTIFLSLGATSAYAGVDAEVAYIFKNKKVFFIINFSP